MLKLLKRWLGWDRDSSLFDFSSLPRRPRTPDVAPPSTQPSKPKAPAAPTGAAPAARRRPPKEREPLDVLHNPRLTLDKPSADGFDPYNTGAFNRSASWDKIGRQRKR